MSKKQVAYALSAIIAIATLLMIVVPWNSQFSDNASYESRRIRYRFTISNRSGNLIEDAVFRAFAPVGRTAAQQCGDIEASHAFKIRRDDPGNQILEFHLDRIPPHGNRVVTVTATVDLYAEPVKSASSEADAFLNPEKNIPSNHPSITEKAGDLKKDDSEQTIVSFFEWISRNIVYERNNGPSRGALYALENHKGDCTEYADLFTALCRAVRIPARSMGGYICSQDKVVKPLDYHNWSEVYINGAWRIVDPQRNIFKPDRPEYIATRIVHEDQNALMPESGLFWISSPDASVRMD